MAPSADPAIEVGAPSDGVPESSQKERRRKVLGNGTWGMGQQAVGMLSNALLSVLLIQTFTQEMYGAYAYAITLVGFGLSIMTAGLSAIAVKSLVNERPRNASHVASFMLIRELFALLGYVVIGLTSLTSGSSLAMAATLVGGLALFGRAFDAPEMWFTSVMRLDRAAQIRILCALIALAVRVVGLLMGASIWLMLAIYVAEVFVASGLILLRYVKDPLSPGIGKIDFTFIRRMIGTSWPLLLSGMANQINLRSDLIVVQALLGASSVAVYSAASRISEIAYFLPVIFMNATFPLLLESRKRYGAASLEYKGFVQAAYDRAFWIGVAIAIPIAAAAPVVVPILFGEEYAAASLIIAIQVIACPFVFMAAVFSKWIVAESKYWVSLLRHSAGAVINVALTITLLPVVGLVGAAWSTVVSYIVASYISCFFTRSTRVAAIQMSLAMVAPVRWAYSALTENYRKKGR
jgi:O-antigen/teichoic acid export membrane protein